MRVRHPATLSGEPCTLSSFRNRGGCSDWPGCAGRCFEVAYARDFVSTLNPQSTTKSGAMFGDCLYQMPSNQEQAKQSRANHKRQQGLLHQPPHAICSTQTQSRPRRRPRGPARHRNGSSAQHDAPLCTVL